MSRIDELIADKCPDGVAFRTVGDVTSKASKVKWPSTAGAPFQYIDLSSVDRNTHRIGVTTTIAEGNAPSRAQQIVEAGDVIFATTRPAQMRWAVIPDQYSHQIASTGYCVLRPDTSVMLTGFLAHMLGSDDFRRYVEANQVEGNYPAIPDGRVRAYRLPVPPLEVQREIAGILDKFSQLKAEMEAQLEAELEARRRQYDYYRSNILTFDDDVERVFLGDVATIGTGSHDTKDAVADGEYVFYARGREPFRLDSFDFDETAIITAGDGVGVGKVFHFASGRYALHQRAYRIVPGEQIDARYLYHYLVADFTRYLERTSVHASVTSLRRPMFLRYPVALPSFEEQRRISSILDKFDALSTDLSIGLPAEISARRKQYEHFRDKLLTFEELPA